MSTERPRRVGLVVDNPRRDLNGLTLVARSLGALGHQAILVPMYVQGYDVPLLGLDGIVVNYARPNNMALLQGYRALGLHVSVLDTEGGVLSSDGADSPANWSRTFRERGLHRSVDLYLFWGEKLHDAFRDGSGLAAAQLKVTGCPRYDLCASPWKEVLSHHRKDYVLINTNFSAINPAFTASTRRELRVFESAGWAPEYARQLFNELESVFPRYLDSIENLARCVPDRLFVVRPHPFENTQRYTRRFATVPNIVVDPEGDVLNVIRNAHSVVHLNCGTSVESLLLKKVAFSMEYLNTAVMRRHAPLPSRVSVPVGSEAELIAMLQSSREWPSSSSREEVAAREIVPWFHRIDGCASLRVASAVIEAIGQDRPRAAISVKQALRGGVAAPRPAQLLQGMSSCLLGSLAVSTLRERFASARANKSFSLRQVATALESFNAVDGRSQRLCVEHARNPVTGLRMASIELSPA